MTTDHVVEQLVTYISGNLDEESGRRVREHIDRCESCRVEYESYRAMWSRLGEVPIENPGPGLRGRVLQMIESYDDGTPITAPAGSRPARSWAGLLFPMRPGIQWGISLALLLIGLLVGYGIRSEQANGDQLVQLRQQVQDLGRLLTVSLLQQQSAADRLRGVNWSYRFAQSDQEVTHAVLDALRHDPNVNVRLAALDALTGSINNPDVRRGLIQSLPEESSPLVQLALVDVMVQLNDPAAIAVFEHMLKDSTVNETVRTRIKQSIPQL